jgi:hypothetical protein
MPREVETAKLDNASPKRGLLHQSVSTLKDLFATWSVIGSVMAALATLALIVRFGAIDWPLVLWSALRDYYGLIHLLAGFVVPRSWPAWSADALNVYLWMAVAIYMRGFSRFGPASPATAFSRIAWLLVDIVASAVWPITLLGVLVYGIVAAWIAVAVVIAITSIALKFIAIFATPFAGYREPSPLPAPPKLTAFIVPVIKHVLGAVVKAFATTAILVVAFLVVAAALGAATTGLGTPPGMRPDREASARFAG